MKLSEPASWTLLWFAVAGLFVAAEMVRRLRLYFLPLAVGALVAGLSSWVGVPVSLEIVLFLAVSAVLVVALRPLARYLAAGGDHLPEGSARWVGHEGVVEAEVPDRGTGGWVRLGRERWRAESGLQSPLPAGTAILVSAVHGNHLVVLPVHGLPVDAPLVNEAGDGPTGEEGG